MLDGVPERPFGELESGADAAYRRLGVDEGGEIAAAHVVGHLYLLENEHCGRAAPRTARQAADVEWNWGRRPSSRCM